RREGRVSCGFGAARAAGLAKTGEGA
ncbi:MAG: hypothetical protein RIT14_2045, partial [Pseudomonadota bacterium]